MALSGEFSRHKDEAERMFSEVHEKGTFEVVVVDDSAHYLAEENPEGFVREVLRFVRLFSCS